MDGASVPMMQRPACHDSADSHHTTEHYNGTEAYTWGTLQAEDLLVCTLCSQYFKDPRVLTCDHTFCRKCLQESYNERQARYGTRIATMPCPTCHARTHLPIMGVAGLPVDSRMRRAKEVFVNELMEDVRRRSSAEPESPAPQECVTSEDSVTHTDTQSSVNHHTEASTPPQINTTTPQQTSKPRDIPPWHSVAAQDTAQDVPVKQSRTPPQEQFHPTSKPPTSPYSQTRPSDTTLESVQENISQSSPRSPVGTPQDTPSPTPPPRTRSRRARVERAQEASLPSDAATPPRIHVDYSEDPQTTTTPSDTEPQPTPPLRHRRYHKVDSERYHSDLSSSLPRSFTDPDLAFAHRKTMKGSEKTDSYIPKSHASLLEPRDKDFSFTGLRRSNSDRLRSRRTQELEEEILSGGGGPPTTSRASKFLRRSSRRNRANRDSGEPKEGYADLLQEGRARSGSFGSTRFRTESPSFGSPSFTSSKAESKPDTSQREPDLESSFEKSRTDSPRFSSQYDSPKSAFSSTRFERNRPETPTFGSSRFERNRAETPTFGSSRFERNRSETPTFGSSRFERNRAETPTFGSPRFERNRSDAFTSSDNIHRSETPTFESKFGKYKTDSTTYGSDFGLFETKEPKHDSKIGSNRAETPTFGRDYGVHHPPESPAFDTKTTTSQSDTGFGTRTDGPAFSSKVHNDISETTEAEFGSGTTGSRPDHEINADTSHRKSTTQSSHFTQDSNNNGIFSSHYSSPKMSSRESAQAKRWSSPAFVQMRNSPLFEKYMQESDEEEEETTGRRNSRRKSSSTSPRRSSSGDHDKSGARKTSDVDDANTKSFKSRRRSSGASTRDSPQRGSSTDETDSKPNENGAEESEEVFQMDLENNETSVYDQEIILEEREVEVKVRRTFSFTTETVEEVEEETEAQVTVEVEDDEDEANEDTEAAEEDEEEEDEEEEEEDSPEPVYQPAEQQWTVEKTEHEQPTSMALMPSGKVIVADYGHNNLQFYDDEGNFEFQLDGLKPFSMVVDKVGNLVVGDRKNKTVKMFDEFGTDVAQWPENILDWVSGIGVLSDGTIVVLDRQYCRVKLFNSAGDSLSEFGSYGDRDKQLAMADFLAVDSDDRIIICDSGNHCVKVFDRDGNVLLKFGSRGKKRGELEWPKGVCVDDKDNIIVADTRNNRVCMFSPQGEYIQRLVKDTPNPYAVTFMKPNQLGVTQFTLNGDSDFRIYKLDEVLADLTLEETL